MPFENCQSFLELLEEASNNNSEALHCLKLAVTYFHQFDDIIDGDIELTARELLKVNNVLTRLLTCKFFSEHRGILLATKLLIGDDYAASCESPKFKILRHNGNNFIRVVALITGGEDLMFNISDKLRQFTLKDKDNE